MRIRGGGIAVAGWVGGAEAGVALFEGREVALHVA